MTREELRARLGRMADGLHARPHLLRLGRLFSNTVLFEVDGAEFYLFFRDGRLTGIEEGPSRQTPWRFGLRLQGDALARFWEPIPRPGYHDLFGLVKLGLGRIDGDILELVRNLRFFKEFLALGREEATP
jgi:hypothetical protein